MTSDRKHLSQDISCTKQCSSLQRPVMHFNPETFKVAIQIPRNGHGAKGTNPYVSYSVVIDLPKFFPYDILKDCYYYY